MTSLAGGFDDSYAVLSDGRMLSWGGNDFGQLGTTLSLPNAASPVFVAVPSGVKVTSAVAGDFHVLARTGTGHVLGWGLNNHGQLGDGTMTERDLPAAIPLPGGATVKALSAGAFHSLALTTAGKVLAWGEGTEGELGNGTFSDSLTPVRVLISTTLTVTGIASGQQADHNLAIVHKAAA